MRYEDTRGWVYTFKDGDGAIVMDRADKVIHRAATYTEAEAWANANLDKIDAPLNDQEAR